MLTTAEREAQVALLDTAERNGVQTGLISGRYPDADLDDAYAIQAGWIKRKIAAGRRVIGWKIGLTSRAMQSALNIETPDSGVLLDDMMFETGHISRRDASSSPGSRRRLPLS